VSCFTKEEVLWQPETSVIDDGITDLVVCSLGINDTELFNTRQKQNNVISSVLCTITIHNGVEQVSKGFILYSSFHTLINSAL
jgi:hypothetical protein